MPDPQIVTTLRRKAFEIEKAIAVYSRKLDDARRDLAHVNASIRLFELDGQPSEFPAYVDVTRLFRRGEIVTLCKAALAQEGPLDTRELARRVVKAKGLDASDPVLRSSVALRIVQAMSLQAKRGRAGKVGKRKGVVVWSSLTH